MRQAIRLLFPVLFLVGCASDPVPKPRGYFRIDLPTESYVPWTDSATFSTELPAYARVGIRATKTDARWFDVRFKEQRATVHLTWSPVGDQLENLIEDAHRFKSQHQAMAAKISSERVLRDSARVFGSVFNAVSYTHLDVYKRQPGSCRRGIGCCHRALRAPLSSSTTTTCAGCWAGLW